MSAIGSGRSPNKTVADLLLSVCCAPCALPIAEALAQKGEKPILFFCGPNIYPKEEYDKRLLAAKIVAKEYGLDLIEDLYNHEEWLKYIRQHLSREPASYPENSERCQSCFRYRLRRTALSAKTNFLDEFATTLSVSLHKDVSFINSYGNDLAKQFDLTYRQFDLEPGVAHQRGRELSKKYNIYRQKYCGCEFSRPENRSR